MREFAFRGEGPLDPHLRRSPEGDFGLEPNEEEQKKRRKKNGFKCDRDFR